MFKTLMVPLAWLLLSNAVHGRVTMRWLSVTGIILEDGESTLVFDPVFTRPGWRHWLNLEPFKADAELVQRTLEEVGLRHVDALFVSHSHFDHAIDAATVAKRTGAIYYGDENNHRIAGAYGYPDLRLKRITPGTPVKVGKFTIIPVSQEHPKMLGVFAYLPGPVPSDFAFGFYQYRRGDMWAYVIKHPSGNILIDSGSHATPAASKLVDRVEAVVQSVALRESNEDFLKGHLQRFRPRIFVPTHFDDFLTEFSPWELKHMPLMRLEKLLHEIKRAYPEIKLEVPSFNQTLVLLEGEG